MGEGPAADPDHGLDDDGDHRGGQAEEQPGQQRGVAVGDIDRGQAEQGQHAGQHEQAAGDQTTTEAVEQPAGVDGQLLRFGTGQQHAVVEGVQEPAVPDPAFLIDQGPLHHRDLTGRTAEGLQTDQKPRPHRLTERDDVAGNSRSRRWVACAELLGSIRLGGSWLGARGLVGVAVGVAHAGSFPASRARWK